MGLYEQAISDFTMAIEFEPDSVFAFDYLRELCHNIGRDDYTIEVCSKTIDTRPSCYLAYVSRGDAFAGKGEYGLAIADYTRAIALGFDDSFGYWLRGNAYSDSGELSQAIADYSQAILVNPKEWCNYDGRGRAYAANSQPDLAMIDYNRCDSVRSESQ